jgi:DNA-binding NarL/FixJ family response regulator
VRLAVVPSETSLSVVIVDDDPLVRRVVKDTLEDAGILVLAEGEDGREAVELARQHRPDVMLIDIVMPQMDGIAATRQILETHPDQVVVMLTGSDDDDIVVLGLRAGAAGFLTKDLRIESLPRAIEGLRDGEAAVSRRMTMRLIEHLRRTPAGRTGLRPVQSGLTEREWEVLDLIGEGLTNDAIARRLVVSVETVRTHVKHILRKMGVRTRQDAVAKGDLLRDHADAPISGDELPPAV